RHFRDPQSMQRRFHDSLTGKLHPSRAQIETLNRGLTEAAQAAVKITAWAPEKDSSNARQHGIAEIPVKRRHRVRRNAALEAITDHELVAGAQLLEERAELSEVVTVVGVAHNDVRAARGLNTAEECAAITLFGHMNHSRA